MSGSFIVSLQTEKVSVSSSVDQKQETETPAIITLPVSFPESTEKEKENEPHIIFEAPQIFQFHFSSSSSSSVHTLRQTVVVEGEEGGAEPLSEKEGLNGILTSLRNVEDRCIQQLSAAAHVEWISSLKTQEPQQSGSIFSTECNLSSIQQLERLGAARARYVEEMRTAISKRCRWSCSSSFSVEFPSTSLSLVLHSEAFGLLLFCRDKLGLSSLLAVDSSQQNSKREVFTLTPSAVYIHPDSEKDKTNRPAVEVPVDGLWIIDLWKWAYLQKSRSSDNSKGMGNQENPLNMFSAFCVPWEKPSVIRSEHVWCNCKRCETLRCTFWREKQAVESMCFEKIINEVLNGIDSFGSISSLTLNQNHGACKEDSDMNINNDELKITSAHVISALYRHLSAAVCRATAEALQHINQISKNDKGSETSDPFYVGILFSGGVDSSLISGLVLRILAAAMTRASGVHTPDPSSAAENMEERGPPQLISNHSSSSAESSRRSNDSFDENVKGKIVVELVSVCFSAEAPDRLTALRSFLDLLGILRELGKPFYSGKDEGDDADVSSCVVVGNWLFELRLVAVDVCPAECMQYRKHLLKAIYPKRSHMDFNIAAPLFFASRGIGYLVSPNFSKSEEWKKLCEDAAVWRDLIIRPPPLPRFHRSKTTAPMVAKCMQASADSSTTQCMQEEGEAAAAGLKKDADDGVVVNSCRICSRQAKEGCMHAACKLCCEKLRAVANAAAGEGEGDIQNACIYVGGRGKIPISSIGFQPQTSCPVHRCMRKIKDVNFSSFAEKEKEKIINEKGIKKKHACMRPAPFESLEIIPCGVPLATTQGIKPFMAMNSTELKKWFSQKKEKRDTCVDLETGDYYLQSRVLLMGSGADELFGGYGRHRTANLTRGGEALKKEQIVDLERLWLRNMGRDSRVFSSFNRIPRFPFLDENLLKFICIFVPFEHIVKPTFDLETETETMLQKLQKKALLGMDGKSEKRETDARNCLSNDLLEDVEKRKKEDEIRTDVPCIKNQLKEDLIKEESLCFGNKWLLRFFAAKCKLPFSAVAKKRAMQFGSRSAKTSNKESFSSNRKARGDACIEEKEETERDSF